MCAARLRVMPCTRPHNALRQVISIIPKTYQHGFRQVVLACVHTGALRRNLMGGWRNRCPTCSRRGRERRVHHAHHRRPIMATNLTCSEAAKLPRRQDRSREADRQVRRREGETSSRVRWERLHAPSSPRTSRASVPAATDAEGRKAALAKFEDSPRLPSRRLQAQGQGEACEAGRGRAGQARRRARRPR